VKVGEGESAARWRLESPAATRAWLAAWLEKCGSASDVGGAKINGGP
jgi:hypothetical protein